MAEHAGTSVPCRPAKKKNVNKKKASYIERLKQPSAAVKGRAVARANREAKAAKEAEAAAKAAAAEAAEAAAAEEPAEEPAAE